MYDRWAVRWFFYYELMHLADCKGVAAIAFGSVFELLLQKAALGPNRAARLAHINGFLRQWYAERPGSHRVPPLRLTNVRGPDGWADLHGPTIKAANTRGLAPLVRDLAREQFVSGSREDTAVVALCDGLADFYSALYAAPLFLPEPTVDHVRALCVSIGENWMVLRQLARRRGMLLWKITPKVHKLQHAPLYCQVLNPRHVQAYSEESLVGTAVKVWKKSVSGRYRATVQDMVVLKRLLALILRFEV